ncbi:MAG: VirB3 family type IV secretion system protein [Proteobacteria bacterium]|nr:VirB3 family type IV secretion system protein [Pseudomonadota bacterium]
MSEGIHSGAARGVIADPLFVGITRPAMALGVPYAALLGNAFLTLELFLVTRNLLCLLVAAPLHGLAWLLCLMEPRAFDLIGVWARVRARAGFRGRHPWRAASYAPLAPGPDRASAVAASICSARCPR